MRYAIVPYPIPEEILKSGFIAQNNKTARTNNSTDKCIVSYSDAYHSIFKKYATLEADELLDFISKNTREWSEDYIEPAKDVLVENTQKTYAISDNYTPDGKVLYTKIHGQKAVVKAGELHSFNFVNVYNEIFFQGAEVMQDIIGVADFHVRHPAGMFSIEQYGYDVNLGTIKYIRESKYAARIPKGLIVSCDYTNDTTSDQEVGVNFLMHEIKDVL